MKRLFYAGVFAFLCLLLPIFLASCGGGGGSGGDGGGGGTSSAQGSVGAAGGINTGSVAVTVTDDPADCYEHIWIWVTKVSLLPSEGAADQRHEVIFESESPDGYKVDLLRYQDDEEFLLALKDDVRAGTYTKVRLEVSSIESEAKVPCQAACDCDSLCDEDDWKLPSDKIDLNPQGTFNVEPGGTLFIRLDIDANNSIHASASCNFRPVVFVDIWSAPPVEVCPQIVTGTIISKIADGDDLNDQIEGIVLNRDSLPTLEVSLPAQVPIFDEQGEPGLLPNDLSMWDEVTVRGKVNHGGEFVASLVVVMALNDILIVDGIAEGPVDENGFFPFSRDPDQEIGAEDPVSVEVFSETQILLGCDTNGQVQDIVAGMRVRVYGKLLLGENDVIRSFVLILRADEIVGGLIALTETEGGNSLTVETDGGTQRTVFLPEDVSVYLKGDGEIPLDLLRDLVHCDPRQVRIDLDSEDDGKATEVRVIDDLNPPNGTVVRIDDDRVLDLGDMDVKVMPGATILGPQGTTWFDDIQLGSIIQVFGLWACDQDDVDFYAFIVRIN